MSSSRFHRAGQVRSLALSFSERLYYVSCSCFPADVGAEAAFFENGSDIADGRIVPVYIVSMKDPGNKREKLI